MTPHTTEAAAVRLQRTIPAPPERVYRAWLDPDLLRGWMTPPSLHVTDVEVDERPGGRYAVWQAGPDDAGGGFVGELLELDPPRRLVWRWGWAGPQREAGPVYDSHLEVTFAPAGDGATELTLVHTRLEALDAGMPGVAELVGPGWAAALDGLERVLAA